MANTLKIKRGTAATIPQGQLAEPLFTTDTYDLYIGKGAGGNQRIQNYIASGTSSQFLKGDGSLDSTTYQATSEKGQNNGYASLDSGGKVPVAQLPNSIMEYKGTWDASTNTPTLADGTGNAGDVYIVSVGGTQNLGSGSITFAAGDWVVYSGSVWQKSINSNAVASVNGQTGAVVLYTDDISEDGSPTNLWFTNARARAAISLTTNNTSGAATYDNSTGVLNIPQYQGVLTNPVTGTGTNNEIAYFNTTGSTISSLSTATYPSLTELSYVKGVTSAIQTQLNAKQAQLNGTGFVKASGTTISYDNSTYLTTSSASSTYLPLAGGTLTGALIGTTASFTSNSGNFTLGSQAGTAIYAHFGTKSASGGQGVGMRVDGTLTATANFDNLYGLWVDYTVNTAGYLGVTTWGIVQNDSSRRNYFGGLVTFNSAITVSDTATATAFIPTGTSVPSRGMYTSASNVLDFSAGTTNLLSLNYNTGLSTFNTGVKGSYFRIVNVSTAEYGINTENNQGYIGTTTSHGFNIMTNNTPRLTFHATTGAATFSSSVTATQLSINTTTTDGRIDVRPNGVSSFPIYWRNNNGGYGGGVYVTGGNNMQLYLANSAGTDNVLISASGTSFFNGGNVGIGTTDPQSSLHIIKALGNNVISIGETGNNTRFTIGQEASYTGNYINSTNIDLKIQSYLAGGSGGNIIFQTGASGSGSLTERMRITSSGNLLFNGTSNPGGIGNIYIGNSGSLPGTPSGGGVLYVEGGALKFKGSSGTITTIANA